MKQIKTPINKETILHYLNYKPETGEFTWRVPTSNRVLRGAKFGSKNKGGYIIGRLLGIKIYVHHLVWIVEKGAIPSSLDHIDGDPTNNRIINLREVSQRVNTRNQRKHSHNTSGYTGVGYVAKTGKYRAYIGGRAEHCGYFDTIEEAIAAREKAELRLGYSPTHGKRK